MPYSYTGTRDESRGLKAEMPEGWNDEAARLEELYLEEGKELGKGMASGQQPVTLSLQWLAYNTPPIGKTVVTDGVFFVARSLRPGEFSGVVWTDKDREEMMPAGVIIYAVPVRGLLPLWKKLQVENEQRAKEASWLGGDPAANELDPESERQEDGLWAGRPCHKLDALAVPVVPEGSVVDGCGVMSDAEEVAMLEEGLVSYQWAWNEGADLATEELAGGWRADELMRRVFAPCPYKLGSLPRVWWLRGFKETVDAAERAAAAA